jgi:uncharacterized protein (TIGR04255 family)
MTRKSAERESRQAASAVAPGLPEFDRPPVNEVVFGLQFQPLEKMRVGHFGKYWQRIGKRYPNTEEHVLVAHQIESAEPALIKEGAQMELEIGSFPLLPRCWFSDDSKLHLLQVQFDRFLRNWRQVEGQEPYPRYPTLFQQFKSDWIDFRQFLTDEKVGSPVIDQCELTYINNVPRGDAWKEPKELSRVFTLWSDLGKFAFLPGPELAACKLTYRLPDNRGRLHVQLKQGVRSRDKTPMFVLELTARGAPVGQMADDLSSWFSLAHEWIVRSFADLTTPDMHKLWGRTQ